MPPTSSQYPLGKNFRPHARIVFVHCEHFTTSGKQFYFDILDSSSLSTSMANRMVVSGQ